jgi:hypothetical protein
VSGHTCDDHDVCTPVDRCEDGVCKGSGWMNCDDQEVCTQDSCDPQTGCFHKNLDDVDCDDFNACTGNDRCEGGKCRGVDVSACNDGNECTKDSCDSPSGCFHEDIDGPCTPEDPCYEQGYCSGGKCFPSGTACDDKDSCTEDFCKSGKCYHVWDRTKC